MAGIGKTRRDNLWAIIAGPSIWAAHFMLSYATAAIWCAKVVGKAGWLEGGGRLAIMIYSVVALAGILAIAVRGYRRHSTGRATAPHDFPTDNDRHRFIGFATLLLSGLSFVATLYVTVAALMVGSCQ